MSKVIPSNIKFPFIDNCKWEEIPTEDLWQDGELNSNQVMDLLYIKVVQSGEWKLMRRKNDT